MRIFLMLLASIAIYSTAFINHKCDHAFTQVEQPVVKIERQTWTVSVYTPPPTGLQKGNELICVKCFHKQKQILDYGQPDHGLRLSEQQKGFSIEDHYTPSPYTIEPGEYIFTKPRRTFTIIGDNSSTMPTIIIGDTLK